MKGKILKGSWFALLAASIVPLGAAHADGRASFVHAKLSGYNEVPSVSTPAKGWFGAIVSEKAGKIFYRLSYRGFESPASQAHLHFGQQHTIGGPSAFLCSNLGNGPAGTPPCPASGAVSGVITAAGVVGPAGEGIAPGEFEELVDAIRAGAIYVNVHSGAFPGGEIRGQVE